MRVRARKVQAADFPLNIRWYMGDNQTFVTHPNEYDVHAMALFDGLLFLQIVDDIRFPAWVPFVLFEVLDGTMPKDWKCNTFPQNGANGLVMLVGPEFVVRDEQSYQGMVELNADQVDRFWKRIDSLSQADDLEC